MRSKTPAAGTMTGGCLCGAIRYEVTGEPIFSTHCHCRDCQRASGSAYVATARLPVAGFRITKGSPKRFVDKADSGNEVTRVFCARLWLASLQPSLGPLGSDWSQSHQPR
jgi:hypothetical protein